MISFLVSIPRVLHLQRAFKRYVYPWNFFAFVQLMGLAICLFGITTAVIVAFSSGPAAIAIVPALVLGLGSLGLVLLRIGAVGLYLEMDGDRAAVVNPFADLVVPRLEVIEVVAPEQPASAPTLVRLRSKTLRAWGLTATVYERWLPYRFSIRRQLDRLTRDLKGGASEDAYSPSADDA